MMLETQTGMSARKQWCANNGQTIDWFVDLPLGLSSMKQNKKNESFSLWWIATKEAQYASLYAQDNGASCHWQGVDKRWINATNSSKPNTLLINKEKQYSLYISETELHCHYFENTKLSLPIIYYNKIGQLFLVAQAQSQGMYDKFIIDFKTRLCKEMREFHPNPLW